MVVCSVPTGAAICETVSFVSTRSAEASAARSASSSSATAGVNFFKGAMSIAPFFGLRLSTLTPSAA